MYEISINLYYLQTFKYFIKKKKQKHDKQLKFYHFITVAIDKIIQTQNVILKSPKLLE